MSKCSHEIATNRSVRTGNWSADLEAHVLTCDQCSELALVGGVLNEEYRRAIWESGAVETGRIWQVAHLRAQRMNRERAPRPIAVIGMVGLICAGLAVIVLWAGASARSLPWMVTVSSWTTKPFEITVATVVFTVSALALVLPMFNFLIASLED